MLFIGQIHRVTRLFGSPKHPYDYKSNPKNQYTHIFQIMGHDQFFLVLGSYADSKKSAKNILMAISLDLCSKLDDFNPFFNVIPGTSNFYSLNNLTKNNWMPFCLFKTKKLSIF